MADLDGNNEIEATSDGSDDEEMMESQEEEGEAVAETEEGNGGERGSSSSDSSSSDEEDGNGITLQSIRDGVVGASTRGSYIRELVTFLSWVASEKREWLTLHGRRTVSRVVDRRDGEGQQQHSTRARRQLAALLRQAEERPLLHLDVISPEGYMEYLMSCRHPRHGSLLGKSAYGSKRSALFHLFCLHNKRGFPEDFRLQLGNLFRGFYRQLPRQRQHNNQTGMNLSVKEGKDAMSVALYEKLGSWFLEWGTLDGVFAHCFLVLSWNLSCRSNNTAEIFLTDINWAGFFDTFDIYFAHTKTDQTGSDAKYPRHLYANPTNPLVCPVFALALHFSCNYNTPVDMSSPLFHGSDQHARFGKLLNKCLREHETELHAFGYQFEDLGTHSIRKGAVSYLASLVGGPPAAATCIRAGWTMGKVRDIYMRYVASGDQFVGRCLSLLPIHSVKFGVSPPFFSSHWEQWGMCVAEAQLTMLCNVTHLRRLAMMCTASLLHHRTFVLSSLQPNHVIRSSHVFRNASLLRQLDDDRNILLVKYPWNDESRAFSGIPPHVVLLQKMERVREQQESLMNTFVDKVRTAIDESGLSGSGVTEQQLQRLFDGFSRTLRDQLNTIGTVQPTGEATERVETGVGYQWHYFDGRINRVPKDWRFPRVGVLDAWRQWWIGDSVRNVPPLRNLKASDLEFLDKIPLGPEEMHGRSGRHKTKRRPARKTYSDLAFLMNYITNEVEKKGGIAETITVSSVDGMYNLVVDELIPGGRDAQKKWITVVREIRKKLKGGQGGGQD